MHLVFTLLISFRASFSVTFLVALLPNSFAGLLSGYGRAYCFEGTVREERTHWVQQQFGRDFWRRESASIATLTFVAKVCARADASHRWHACLPSNHFALLVKIKGSFLVAHHCWDPCRATQRRAHNVAANSRSFRDVAGMSRYIPHPPPQKKTLSHLSCHTLCHCVAGKFACKNGSRYTRV